MDVLRNRVHAIGALRRSGHLNPERPAVDPHYTPSWLADRLAGAMDVLSEDTVVADLAAGNGALLEGAVALWGSSASYLAYDSDARAVAALRRAHPEWVVEQVDIFTESFPAAVHRRCRAVDNLLLNPPFSYRGAGGVIVDLPHISGRFSPAIAFVLRALTVLKPGGQCLAILPSNSLASDRDAPAIEYLSSFWGLRLIDRLPFRTFPRIHARTVLVEIGGSAPRLDKTQAAPSKPSTGEQPEVLLVRGTVPMFRTGPILGGEERSLLHTTGMSGGSVQLRRVGVPSSIGRVVVGPFVALPRVGAPTQGKVCVFQGTEAVTLSDCVFALKPLGDLSASSLRASVIEGFEELSERYQGSCAPYLTLSRLSAHLRTQGLKVTLPART